MPFAASSAIIAGGLALGGAVLSSDASRSAPNKQGDALKDSTNLQREQLHTTQGNLSPYLSSGSAANNYLAQLMGVPGATGDGSRIINGQTYGNIDQVKDIWRQDYISKLKEKGYGANMVDEAAIDRGVAREWEQAQIAPGTQSSNFGSLLKPFGQEDFQASPAYQFNLDQGRKAIDKASAARGTYYAPQTLQDISKFSQGLASNEFQTAYNNYNTNMGNIFGRLQSMSGAGQNAAAMQGGFGQNFANSAGNNLVNSGNVQASGIIGQSNAITGAASQGYNNYMLQQILSKNQSPTYPSGGGSNGLDT